MPSTIDQSSPEKFSCLMKKGTVKTYIPVVLNILEKVTHHLLKQIYVSLIISFKLIKSTLLTHRNFLFQLSGDDCHVNLEYQRTFLHKAGGEMKNEQDMLCVTHKMAIAG